MTRKLGLAVRVFAIVAVALAAALGSSRADDEKTTAKPGVDAKTAFTKIKTLAGNWNSQTSEEPAAEHANEKEGHPKEASVNFKLTGAGSALVETQFPGQSHEMVSVYHLDGDDLRMTHYCAAGNQPRVKLDRVHSTPDELIFVFDGGTNLNAEKDHHIHGVKITFNKDGTVTSVWEGYAGGKKASAATFKMTRQP
jgi:hypothetical protein